MTTPKSEEPLRWFCLCRKKRKGMEGEEGRRRDTKDEVIEREKRMKGKGKERRKKKRG